MTSTPSTSLSPSSSQLVGGRYEILRTIGQPDRGYDSVIVAVE